MATVNATSPKTELNAFWRRACTVVSAGDFVAYAEMYHPDAVLVQLNNNSKDIKDSEPSEESTVLKLPGTTQPIAQALEQWKAGFDATRQGLQRVELAFRFEQRLHGPTTAHETGIFRYESSNLPNPLFMHFESLLVKKESTWLWLMEYQKNQATETEWNALEPFADETAEGNIE